MTAVVAVAGLLAAACAAHMPEYQKAKVPYLNQDKFKVPGTPARLLDMLDVADATNVVVGRGAGVNGELIEAIAADNLRHVYIYVDSKFLARAKIPYDKGRAPLHPMVKVLRSGGRDAVIMFADVMTIGGKKSGLLVLFDSTGVKTTAPLPIEGLVTLHGGMRDPYVGGSDIETGVLFTARDGAGNAWSKIYVIRLKGKKLEVEDIAYQEAYGCSCFTDWLNGKDGRALFGDIVKPSKKKY